MASEEVPPTGRSTDIVQVVTVIDDPATAQELAQTAVQERLAACVQVDGPVRSTYRWEDELHTDEEWRVVAKTTATAGNDLVTLWTEQHTYDTPEIVVVAVLGGHHGYMEWVDAEVVVARHTGH